MFNCLMLMARHWNQEPNSRIYSLRAQIVAELELHTFQKRRLLATQHLEITHVLLCFFVLAIVTSQSNTASFRKRLTIPRTRFGQLWGVLNGTSRLSASFSHGDLHGRKEAFKHDEATNVFPLLCRQAWVHFRLLVLGESMVNRSGELGQDAEEGGSMCVCVRLC